MLHHLFTPKHAMWHGDTPSKIYGEIYVCIKETEHSCVFFRPRDGVHMTLGKVIVPELLKQLT